MCAFIEPSIVFSAGWETRKRPLKPTHSPPSSKPRGMKSGPHDHSLEALYRAAAKRILEQALGRLRAGIYFGKMLELELDGHTITLPIDEMEQSRRQLRGPPRSYRTPAKQARPTPSSRNDTRRRTQQDSRRRSVRDPIPYDKRYGSGLSRRCYGSAPGRCPIGFTSRGHRAIFSDARR